MRGVVSFRVDAEVRFVQGGVKGEHGHRNCGKEGGGGGENRAQSASNKMELSVHSITAHIRNHSLRICAVRLSKAGEPYDAAVGRNITSVGKRRERRRRTVHGNQCVKGNTEEAATSVTRYRPDRNRPVSLKCGNKEGAWGGCSGCRAAKAAPGIVPVSDSSNRLVSRRFSSSKFSETCSRRSLAVSAPFSSNIRMTESRPAPSLRASSRSYIHSCPLVAAPNTLNTHTDGACSGSSWYDAPLLLL